MPKPITYYKPRALGERGPSFRGAVYMSHLAERLKAKRRAMNLSQKTAAPIIGISYCALCNVEQGGKIGPRIGPKIHIFLTTRYDVKQMPDGTLKATPKA